MTKFMILFGFTVYNYAEVSSLQREWLRSFRKSKGLKQQQAAELIGINRVYYTQIEGGTRNFNLRLAKRISDALQIPWQAFYDNE